jgi:hypothetical protein
MSGLFRAKWSTDIHREWMAAVAEKAGVDVARLDATRQFMDASVPDALVVGYDDLIPALTLPDPDDRHVLAAAIRCGASAIVTFNAKDFPDAELSKYGLHTKHPDHFIRDIDGLSPGVVAKAAKADRLHYRHPSLSTDEYIEGIKTAGLAMVACHLNKMRVLLEE